jgi:hypothetical protein
MKALHQIILMWTGVAFVATAAAAIREESIPLGENRKVSVAVPSGFKFDSGVDARGAIAFKLTTADDDVSVQVEFLPDVEERFANGRARKELMNQLFSEYVESSTEKAMQFEELEPSIGAGSYCVFTDAKLVNRAELPPGEFRHLTVGVKAWPGVVAVFTCFSNDLKSARYTAVMRMLRESVHEKPVPLK